MGRFTDAFSSKSKGAGKDNVKDSSKDTGKNDSLEKHEKYYQPGLSKLRAGVYGHFPSSFSINYVGSSKNKKSVYFCLREGESPAFQTFTWHNEVRKHQLTLHSTVDVNSPPLAFSGTEAYFRSTTVLVLPAPPGDSKNFVFQRMKPSSIGLKLAKYTFGVPVAEDSQVSPTQPKTFAWQCANTSSFPAVYELMEVSAAAAAGSEAAAGPASGEVFARFTEGVNPGKDGNLGEVQFCGKGLSGEMGDYWTLSVVLALMSICQCHWALTKAVDKMAAAGGAILGGGIGIGLGAIGL